MSLRATPPRLTSRLGLGFSVPLAVLLAAQRVAAAPPSASGESVVIWPPQCEVERFPLVPFVDILRVELAGRGLLCCMLTRPGEALPTGPALHVKVEIVPCAADAERVQVSVREPADSRAGERELSLADVAPTARPRALALAVAELIRTLRQERPKQPPPIPVTPSMVPAPPAPRAATETVRSVALSLHVEAEARGMPTRETITWGGRARFIAHWWMLHADVDLGANYARAGSELGDVLLRSVSAGFGLGPRFATRSLLIDLGPRVELGWAWTHGETRFTDVRTGSGSDLFSSVGFRLSLQAPARVKTRPSLTLEAGGIIHGIKAEVNGQPVAGMTGYYLLAALGIAVSL